MTVLLSELLTNGTYKFGKLTIGYPTTVTRIPKNLRVQVPYTCDCGNTGKIWLANVLYGLTTSCGCDDPFYLRSDYLPRLQQYHDYATRIGCNLGIAKVFMERGISYDQARTMLETRNTTISASDSYYRCRTPGIVVNGSTLVECDTLKIQHDYHTTKVTDGLLIFDTFECICGYRRRYRAEHVPRCVNMDGIFTYRYSIPKCRCEVFSDYYSRLLDPSISDNGEYYLGHWAKSIVDRSNREIFASEKVVLTDINRIRNELRHGMRTGDDRPPTIAHTTRVRKTFDRSKCTRPDIGTCAHYCGDDGCLTDLLYHAVPKRFKEGYTCFTADSWTIEIITRARKAARLIFDL